MSDSLRAMARAPQSMRHWFWALPLTFGMVGCASVKVPDLVGGSKTSQSTTVAAPKPKTRAQRSEEQRARAGSLTAQRNGNSDVRKVNLVLSDRNAQAQGATSPQGRDQKSLAQLFAKQTVTGTELVAELKTMRSLLQGKGVSGLSSAFASDSTSTEATKQPSLQDQLKGALVEKTLSALDSGSSGSMFASSADAIREHLSALIEDTGSMSKETISLPSADGMTQRQMQKTVNLAAVTVATRVSGRMLKKAQEDFKGIEAEYAELIDRREKAATALYGVLSASGGAAGDGKAGFSEADLEYLRGRVSNLSLAQFSTDMGVQQLALNYLKATDPQAWQDYTRKSGNAIKGTQGIIKTLTGVASFGGMAAYVGREVMTMAKKRQYADLIRTAPILATFSTEAAPLLSYSAEAAYAGVEVAVKSTKRFRVSVGDRVEEVSSASDVFELLRKNGADAAMQAALFRNDSPGLLYRLYQCDATDAGEMLDAAVDPSLREWFFADYRVAQSDDPSFVRALATKTSGASTLGEDVLQRDHRERTDQRSLPIAELQKTVAGDKDGQTDPGYRNWGDEQMMRLIFVNREGTAQYAALQLGDLTLRPVPSAQSIFAYETLVDGCRRQLTAAAPSGGRSSSDPPTGSKDPAVKPVKPAGSTKPAKPAKAVQSGRAPVPSAQPA